MEDDVYLCGWTQSAEGFELWVRSRPHIRAQGSTYLEAEEAFLEAIIQAGGAYHAVLEFVPPLPRSEFDEKHSRPELFLIAGDDRFETDEPRRIPFETDAECAQRQSWYDAFFVAPCCKVCMMPPGRRNERRLRLTHVRSSYDGGFVLLAGAMLHVFSERFLMLLSKDERQQLQFQLVDRRRKSAKQFFELVGPSGPPFVALAGREVNGWQCSACGTRVFGYEYSPETMIHSFIAHADLPTALPPVFTVGAQPNVSLCVTAERWASLVSRPGTRGLTSRLLGVAPDDETVRIPNLKPRSAS